MTAVPLQSNAPDNHVEWLAAAPESGQSAKHPSLTRPTVLRFVLPSDVLAVIGAIAASEIVYPGPGGRLGALVATLPYVLVYLAVMAGYGLYQRSQRRLAGSSFPDLPQLVHAATVSTLIVVVIGHPVHELIGLPRPATRCAVAAGVLVVLLVPACRMGARSVARRVHDSRVLVIGSGVVASHVLRRIAAEPGLVVVGCVDDNDDHLQLTGTTGVPLLGGLADVPSLVRRHQVDHVVVAFSPVNEASVAESLRALAGTVQISVVPRMFDLLTVRSRVDDLAGLPVVDVAPPALGLVARTAKRSLDLAVAGVLVLLFSAPMAVIALLVKATSPGPVLFRQARTGRHGQTFRIMKFRTMYEGSERVRAQLAEANEVDGPLFKIRNDSRVTPVGAFLRKSSLDEIPQLFNVLAGHMSLVGPRPFIVAESDGIDGWAARRYDVRPGMTGLWQISGRNDLPFSELRRLDYSYVASWSLWWDLRILWHTPASVLGRRGAY